MSRLGRLYSRLALRRAHRVGRDVVVRGRLWLHGPGRVEVGDGTELAGGLVGIELYPAEGASIRIGARCRISEGTSIEAGQEVVIGDDVAIGAFAKIMDNNWHPLSGDRHHRPTSQPVRIDDGARIGARAVILPGVHVQAGAQVDADAIVTRRVPAGMRVAGNPARAVRP